MENKKEIISYEDWKIQRKAFLAEWKDKRPRCKQCDEKLKGEYGIIPVQVKEPETIVSEEDEFSPASRSFDNGVRWKTDYMDLIGWGWRAGWRNYTGLFCSGTCAHEYAVIWANAMELRKLENKKFHPGHEPQPTYDH
jgi:hypothetical protein